ncbi:MULTISPECIES: MaoC family dehydratase [unclassified Rhodococcus (in: high G+C Gram-positive bacteria)]|uniref:MaoC family dehydratase n=1 Tax=unclassified Rhodococcus (in: high G+C Gram-positive bacteria) TaxID=192944 RepID=UPI000B3CB23B|nr:MULTISPECIES: MaoC family dehydratase [unclassified Rhodococcus (in: high G+C Gram-positive bacteria)]KAF0963190.1 putative enoyl-CoA hydratase 1 [Rhodococcus sp. T7]OUS93287.1 dehydratase [Rhodococcus sp. NCIMB 12038]
MRVFQNIDDVEAAVGEHLGHSDWFEITQDRVNVFADATGDHQWIHVDPERAAEGPFGAPIAHGYLTLSLLPKLGADLMRVEGTKLTINYGLNKVRFPKPVKVGASIRVGGEIAAFEHTKQGAQVVVKYTIEIKGEDKPACVAETVRVLVS